MHPGAKGIMRPVKLVVWLGDVAEPVRVEPVQAFSVSTENELHLYFEPEQVPALIRVLNDTERWQSGLIVVPGGRAR